MNELTICSVYHAENSKHYLDLNQNLVEALNMRRDFSRVVVDNTPNGYAGEKADPKRFRVLRGVPLSEYVKTLEPWQDPFKTSMHLGYALNMALRQVDTRYALILDGDFYIIRKNWIDEVLAYLKTENFAFWGAPWHPRWYKKTRYFPTLHALFIDARQVPLASLDFRPQYKNSDELPVSGTAAPTSFLSTLRTDIMLRRSIGTSQDCTHALYERYAKSAFKFGVLTPVFKPYPNDGAFERSVKLSIDALLPDRFSYTPRRSTYTTKNFKGRGYFDAMGRGWEEFVWRDKPFGFHVRSTAGSNQRDFASEIDILEKTLTHFTEHPVA